ncbi:MAG TPA: hypothetical protein VGW38_27755 [Chloroflexota bacterium]|nr:hypothetical protein [Chloroflexota bacterium]
MSATGPTTLSRWAGPLLITGGILWVPYGILEMLEPWGTDVVYQDDVGYSLVTDTARFVAYSLPGGLALLLTSLGLLGLYTQLGMPTGSSGRIGRILAGIALALAALSVAGVVTLFDPLFTSGRIFGTLALGAATFLAGLDALRDGRAPNWTLALLVLGLLGLFLFPLWPLVFALQWLPEAGGAALIALFGIGWSALGLALLRTTVPRKVE